MKANGMRSQKAATGRNFQESSAQTFQQVTVGEPARPDACPKKSRTVGILCLHRGQTAHNGERCDDMLLSCCVRSALAALRE